MTSTKGRDHDSHPQVEGEEVTEGMVSYAEFLGDQAPEASSLTAEQHRWLVRALKAGATRETAGIAAGIDDLESLLKAEPEVEKLVATLEARAEVSLLAELGESRPAFVLERTRPEKYGPTVSRGLEQGDNPDDDLFEERR